MKTDTRPKWLRRLERESWQAELIISGAAIIGSLQLPWVLEKFQYYLLLHFDRAALKLWFFATAYWALFVYGLILLFILHFVVRALWIGLIGLNSIYPNGIATTNLASLDLQEKTREEYGDIDGLIKRFDRMASGMFGTGFTFAGVFLNIGLIVSVAILVVTFLQNLGVPALWAWFTGLSPLVAGFIASILNTVMSLPKYREKEWVKRYHFPLTKFISRLSYPVNHRFTVSGMMLVTSNSTKTGVVTAKQLVVSGITMIACFFVIGLLLSISDAMKPEFMDSYYHRMGNSESHVDLKNYADSDYEGLLLEPVINTYYPTRGGPLWAWVPLPEREYATLLEQCSVPDVPEDLERPAERKAERQRDLVCAKEYIDLDLDGQPLDNNSMLSHYISRDGSRQYGVRIELSNTPITVGPHQLTVVTHYPLEEGATEDYRTTYIKFQMLEAVR